MFIKLKDGVKVDDFAVRDIEGQRQELKKGVVVEVRDNEAKGLLITYGYKIEETSKPVEEKKEEPKKTTKKSTSKKSK